MFTLLGPAWESHGNRRSNILKSIKKEKEKAAKKERNEKEKKYKNRGEK